MSRRRTPAAPVPLILASARDELLLQAALRAQGWVHEFGSVTEQQAEQAVQEAISRLEECAARAGRLAEHPTLELTKAQASTVASQLEKWRKDLRAHRDACLSRAKEPVTPLSLDEFRPKLHAYLVSEALGRPEGISVHADLTLTASLPKLKRVTLGGELGPVVDQMARIRAMRKGKPLPWPWAFSPVLDEPLAEVDPNVLVFRFVIVPAQASPLQAFERIQQMMHLVPAATSRQFGVITDESSYKSLAEDQGYQCIFIEREARHADATARIATT